MNKREHWGSSKLVRFSALAGDPRFGANCGQRIQCPRLNLASTSKEAVVLPKGRLQTLRLDARKCNPEFVPVILRHPALLGSRLSK